MKYDWLQTGGERTPEVRWSDVSETCVFRSPNHQGSSMKLGSFVAILIGAMFIAGDGAAAEREYRSPSEFTNTLSSAPDFVVEGDLNGDGLSDRGILVGRQEPKIYVLLRLPSGGFRVAQESKMGNIMNTEVALTVQKGSLFVSLNHIDGIGVERGNYQFKLYKGVWRMIGLNHYISETSTDQTTDRSVSTDFNLLTGDVNFERGETGGKSAKSNPVSVREKATGSACLLADFDFDFLFCMENWKTKKGLSVSSSMLP